MLTFPYYEYNTNYNEPHNIIILNNFIENIDTIQSALGKTDHTNYCLRRCYIYECIDIYKKMNKQYCNKQGNKNVKTCEQISPFLTTYSSYIQDLEQIRDKITTPIFAKKNT